MAAHPVYAADVGAGHILAAVAEKGLISADNPLLQGCGDGEDLGGGAGLVGVADTVISPQLIPGLHLLLVAHGVNLRLGIPHGEVPGIVQVVHPVRGHGQNLAGVRIHHHHADVLGAGGGHPLVNVLLHHLLHVQVDGGDHGVAVDRRLDHRLQIGVVVQVAVLPAVGPGENTVVGLLNAPVARGPVAGGEAQNRAGRVVVGVIPFIFLLKPDAVDLFLLLRRDVALGECLVHLVPGGLKPLLLIHRQLPGVADVGAVRIFQDQVGELRLVVAEGCGQGRGGGVQIFILPVLGIVAVHDLPGVDDEVVHLIAHRQISPVPVHNVPPLVGDRPAVIAGVLVQHNLGVLLVIFLDDIVQHQNQCKQSQRNHQNGDRQLLLHIICENTFFMVPVTSVSCSSGCLHFVLYTHFPSDHIKAPDPCRHTPCPALPSPPCKCDPDSRRY